MERILICTIYKNVTIVLYNLVIISNEIYFKEKTIFKKKCISLLGINKSSILFIILYFN